MAKKLSFTNHSPEELQKLVLEKREALRRLRFSAVGSKNRNVKEARNLRKTVARALTQLTTLKKGGSPASK